jgi:hypothetical protein
MERTRTDQVREDSFDGSDLFTQFCGLVEEVTCSNGSSG